MYIRCTAYQHPPSRAVLVAGWCQAAEAKWVQYAQERGRKLHVAAAQEFTHARFSRLLAGAFRVKAVTAKRTFALCV